MLGLSPDIVAMGTFALLMLLVASTGAVFKPDLWYQELAKPAWTPPDWAFPLGWTTLYVMIAIAGFRVWDSGDGSAVTVALGIYGAQLLANAAWSPIFFGMKKIDWALYECGLLWLLIALNIAVFWPIDRTAALLLVPYLAWVTFAGSLNFAILRLNHPMRTPAA